MRAGTGDGRESKNELTKHSELKLKQITDTYN
jgi:hypothetical protein